MPQRFPEIASFLGACREMASEGRRSRRGTACRARVVPMLVRFLAIALAGCALAQWLSPSLPRAAQAQDDEQRSPLRAVELNVLGLAQWRDGDHFAAVASLTESIEILPAWWSPYNNRALARVAAGDPQEALADAEMALSLAAIEPVSADQWAALLDTRAFVHLTLGEYEEALTDYDAAIGTNVGTHVAFPLGRGLALAGLGEEQRALADLKWGTLVAGAFLPDPQVRDLLAARELALALLMLPYAPDSYEPDDSAEQAHPLILDGQFHTRSLHRGDVDWISFPLQAGQGVRIVARGAGCDTYLTLYDPDLVVLWEDDDGGPNGLDATVQSAARKTGTHYAAVRHFFAAQGTCESYELGGTATPPR